MNLGDLALHGIGGIGGDRNAIKSVQTGILSFEQQDTVKNITVDSVDDEKSIVIISSHTTGGGTENRSRFFMASVTSSSNIEIKRFGVSNTTAPVNIAWQLIEFDGIKSVQKGAISESSSISAEHTIAINPVNMGNSIVFHTNTSIQRNTLNHAQKRVRLKSSAELAYLGGLLSGETLNWQVVEFN